MTRKSLNLDNKLYRYLLSISLTEHPVLRRCREETASHPMARMQIAPEQGQFLAFLIKSLGISKMIEVGVFTGYSSLAMALALPDDGNIIACDHDATATSKAALYWRDAKVEHKIELKLAPALETLDQLSKETANHGTFDFAFIDAHKPEYIDYFQRLLLLIRTGGVIAIDNVLWSGQPADENYQDEDTVAIREFNRYLYQEEQVEISLLPIADGLSLAIKI